MVTPHIRRPIYGFRIDATKGATRAGRAPKHRPEIQPSRKLLTDEEIQRDAEWLRGQAEGKWWGAKGDENKFHRPLLAILSYASGNVLSYRAGHAGSRDRARDPIKLTEDEMMPATAGDRLSFIYEFMEQVQYYHGPSEMFTNRQTLALVDVVATLISKDSEMVELMLHPNGAVTEEDDDDTPDFHVCEFCYENQQVIPATHTVGGYPLCEDHAVLEITDIIRNPEGFTSGSTEWSDEMVPFFTEVRMLR